MTRQRPVLLLHGWGGSAQSTFLDKGWGEALSVRGRQVIAPDLPGHGASASSESPDDYADLAGEIERVLPDQVIDVIGYSLGAKLALTLASESPRRFHRIAAIGVGDNAFAPEVSAEAVAVALDTGSTENAAPGVRALVEYSRASGSNPKALAAVLRRPPNPLLEASALGAIGPHTLLLNGSADQLARPDDRLRAALAGSTYVLLEGVTHFQLPGDSAIRKTAARFLDLVDERERATSIET